MHDLLSFTWIFQVPETFARFTNSRNNCYRCNSSLLSQDTKPIKLYWSHLFSIFIVGQFIVNQPSNKRILHVCNISFVLHTQANYAKTLQIEQNIEEWNKSNYIFFPQIFYLHLRMEEKILRHRLSSGGVASPNQRCRQRN